MAKTYELIYKDATLSLSKGHDGFWLYDYTRGFNLAMREKSEAEAYIKAIHCYQDRLTQVEKEYQVLKSRVDLFVSEFVESDED